jgi:hypothetical protein
MKKQVRIRKALPGETPGYYNKTAKFLKKAAMGMEVGAPSMDPAKLNQIYDQVYISLKNDATPDILYNQLINEYALDESTSVMLIKSAMSKLAEEGYVDPEVVKDKAQPEPGVDPQQQADEENERAASDAEQEELAISDGGLYDEEDAQMNQNSALEMTQDEEEQAFKYGGYFDDGGEYPEFEDMNPNQEPSKEQAVMSQYGTPGRTPEEKPFSMEDLIAMTPGTQEMQAFPDLASYLGDYRSSSDSYQPQEYLPQARNGLEVLSKYLPTIGYANKANPLSNLSTVRKALPVFTGIGDAMTRLPYVGPKFTPKLATPFTQNRTELWNVLNGATPKTGVFSQNGTYAGGTDGSLQADRLVLDQVDVQDLIMQLERTNSEPFTLEDLYGNMSQHEGLISGVYPPQTKVIGGEDESGNKFFEFKHTFGPNQSLPFGTTPPKAKEVTFKNRFYYNQDPETGGLNVFDPLGNPLTMGVQTKSRVTRPIGSSITSMLGDAALKDMDRTPFPNYLADIKGATRTDITGLPPTTWNDLSNRGKIGRALETYGTTGLNQLFRTGTKGIESVDYPAYGYANMALGPNIQNPAAIPYSQTASDIKNAINYKYRLGLKTTLIGGGLGYLGYNTYDALANPCQCDDPNLPNFQPKDALGKCTCGTDVGPSRVLDPTPIREESIIDPNTLQTPDSMKFLKGQTPSDYNYYRYQDPNIVNPNTQNVVLPDDFAKGGVSKNRFIDRMVSMYAEGGDATLGQGNRKDTLTNDVANMKSSFISTLKNNSNKAISKDIYKNAQNNPKILNMLMQDGYKENLAEEEQMNTDFTAAFGGFVDMDSKEPLVRFIYGGDESEYYEPYDLEQARDGVNVLNQAGEFRTVADELPFDEWAEGEKEDWQAANPEGDFESWKSDPSRKEDYDNYLDFYSKTLKDYADYGGEDEEEGNTEKCPAGYTWDGFGCVLNTSASLQPKKTQCGPGTVWNDKYNMCIPIAKMNYKYTEVRNPGGYGRNLVPWNPVFGAAGSWVKQKGSPYYLNDGRSYNGLIPDKPVASYTTKKGLLGGRKKWIDIYQVDGDGNATGVPMGDLAQLEGMLDNRRGSGKKSNDGRLDKKMIKNAIKDGWSIVNYKDNEKPEKTSRRDRLEDAAKERFQFSDQEWDEQTRRNKRNLRQAERYEQGRGARYNTDQAYYGARDAVDNVKNAYGTLKSLVDRVKNPSFKRMGGAFEVGTGFGMGAGQNQSGYNPYSQQSQFENDLFGAPAPNKMPQQQNPFSFITQTGTGSYAETANTGNTMGSQGQQIIPQAPEPAPQQNQYVGVERQRKTARNFDGEAGVNAFNSVANFGLGMYERAQNAPIENNMLLDKFDPMANVMASTQTDKGDWGDIGSKTGMFRYDEMGSDRNSRATFGNYANSNAAQYGGYMQNGGYMDDEEVYMTPEELEQFLAAGGQVEYL